MKDGRIIQYSKPEEIVLNPADDYVRTFVAHTNPLNVLRAQPDAFAGQLQTGQWFGVH